MFIEYIKKRFRFLKIVWALGGQSIKYSIIHHTPFRKPVIKLLSDKKDKTTRNLSPSSRMMIDNYSTQFNGAACSVATMEVVLNTLLDMKCCPQKTHRFTQKEILDEVQVVGWKERICPTGNKSRKGLPLPELGLAVEGSLKHFKIPYLNVETVLFDTSPSQLKREKETLLKRLHDFEKKETKFIIAHFNQGIFLRGLHIPHISPVGAFNPETNDVLVLDVDKDGPGPYWVSFENFFNALSNDYNGKLKSYGYVRGGYVHIRVLKSTG